MTRPRVTSTNRGAADARRVHGESASASPRLRGSWVPRSVAMLALAGLLVPWLVSAQGRRSVAVKQVADYRGDMVFTRIAFGGGLRGFGFGGGGDAWSHDYPAADRNVGAIIDYITHARVRLN